LADKAGDVGRAASSWQEVLDTRELALKQDLQLGGAIAIQVQALADFAGDGAIGCAVCLEQ
jgi:hypothetical protein